MNCFEITLKLSYKLFPFFDFSIFSSNILDDFGDVFISSFDSIYNLKVFEGQWIMN